MKSSVAAVAAPARRRGEVARGIGSLALLLVLVVGLPVALWLAVGWPLPRALPSLPQLQDTLARNEVPDGLLVKTIAVLAWLAWLQFAACVLVELTAALQGRVPARVPLASFQQAMARRLVAALLLLVASAPLLTRAAVAAPADQGAVPAGPPAVAVAADVPQSTPAVPDPGRFAIDDEPAVPIAGTPAARTYVVPAGTPGRPRATLWRIAEEHLGDPLRWREIWALNQGRELPDGRRLEDPDWIYPGCVLRMPADAVGLPLVKGRAVPAAAPAAPDPRMDQIAALATELPELVSGGDQAPAPPAVASPAAPEVPPAAPAVSAWDLAPGAAAGEVTRDEQVTNYLVAGAAGLVAAGIVASVGRLRRVRLRRRRSGRAIGLPSPAQARAELALRAIEDPETAQLLDLGLRLLAQRLAAEGRGLPDILGAEVTAERLDVLLADYAPPPEGWEQIDGERRWRLARRGHWRTLAGAASTPAPLPTLAAVGDTDDGVLLLNLERLGVTVLRGAPEPVRGTLDLLAVELATSPTADRIDLQLVGFEEETLDGLGGVRRFHSVDEVLPRLERASGGRQPVIVLCARPPTPTQLARLTAVVWTGPVAVVAPGEVLAAGCTVSVTADRLDVDVLGLSVRPVRLPAGPGAAAGLLGQADDDKDDLPLAAALGLVDGYWAADDFGLGSWEQPVEVRVLGPVELAGAQLDGLGRDAVELVTCLAMHPEGAGDEWLAGVLWPARAARPGDQAPAPRDALFALASATARALEAAAPGAGRPMLHRDPDGRWRLDPSVRLDWARFHALVSDAPAGADGIASLRAALELVRGEPFAGVPARTYGWAMLAHRPVIEATVVDVAEDLARRCLETGDATGAGWAARRGLAASPYDERLYRLLMLAADQDGERARVESTMEELLRRLEAGDVWPDDLHEGTRALYEQLARRA
jgi:hypothetical protein